MSGPAWQHWQKKLAFYEMKINFCSPFIPTVTMRPLIDITLNIFCNEAHLRIRTPLTVLVSVGEFHVMPCKVYYLQGRNISLHLLYNVITKWIIHADYRKLTNLIQNWQTKIRLTKGILPPSSFVDYQHTTDYTGLNAWSHFINKYFLFCCADSILSS